MEKNKEVGNKLADFEILKELGKGSYGTVYTVKSKLNSNMHLCNEKNGIKLSSGSSTTRML